MVTGKVKKLTEKGYGFLTVEGRPKDLFFHAEALEGVSFKELREGDDVEVEGVEPTDRGDQAFGVRRV